jgi:Tol biopolymer transport system component
VARRIESGDGISQPFWSPDSERIGFFASRKLKTVPAVGGPATIVCDAPFGRGATWNASNVIVFAPDPTGPLYRVPGGGGTPTPATTLDTTRKEDNHRFPAFLPDGDHFLFAALPGADGVFQIFAGSLQDPQARTAIGSMESAPVYANPGWLLFTRQGVLTAQPFDAKALKTIGDAITLGDEPTIAQTTAAYDAGRRVSVSTTGSLAFYFEPSTNTRLQWMDPNAKVAGVVSVPPARYSSVTIAPDGTRAVLVRSDSQISSSLWLADLRRDSFVPILMNANKNPLPVWSPDSTRIAFQGERDGRRGLYEKTVDEAAGEVRILPVDNNSIFPRGWSKDRGIIFNQIDPGTKWNIYLVPASGRGAPALLVGGPSIEVGGWPSPDNHWLAYQSDEAGSLDLWVQPFPGPGTRTHVVAGGIQASWWMPDGRHLLYLKRDRSLWQVEVDFRIVPAKIGAPVQLATFPSALVEMDLAPDGRRFLALVPEQAGLGAVTVVERWQAALRAKR